jgi:hypothetical protein
MAEYTFYQDTMGFMESKTSQEADASGNLYSHYLNEDYIYGWGRMTSKVLDDPDPSGAIGICYLYTPSGTYSFGYAQADYSDPSDPQYSEEVYSWLLI